MSVDSPPRQLRSITPLAVALLVVLATVPAGVTAVGQPSATASTVTISEIQTPSGSGDASPYDGQNVTTSGTVTAVTESGFFLQNGTGPYSGVYVYGNSTVSAGETVTVTGLVKEYNGVTEIDIGAAAGAVSVTGTAPVPDATAVSTDEASTEAYEGVLVTVSNLSVTATPGEYGEWAVSDGSGEIAVDDVTHANVTVPSETGGTIDSLSGPVHYTFGAFKIQPTAMAGYTAPTDNGSSAPVDGTTLTVLSYNDIQTAASDPTKMGRLVGAVNSREAAIDNPTVVVGGGDQVSPSSLSPVSNHTVPVETLNTLDPAAEVVGNHDLDYGFAAVEEYSDNSAFPWLVANVRHEDGGTIPGTESYTVVQRGNVTIGIVGLVDDAITSKTAVDFEDEGYEVTDYVSTGSRVATTLKEEENVDVVIAAAHVGVPESETLARNTENIDVIVTGDDEVTYGPKTVDGTVVMEAQARAAYLGEANLSVGQDDTSLDSGRLITLDGSNGYPINQTANDTVANARGQYLSTVAGRTTVPLDSTFSSNYAQETAWGNTVTDAFRAKTGANVAATNAGGIRGDFVIDPGPVTYNDIYTSLPFGNHLVTKEMTGEQLRELLASQVTGLDAQYGAQAQLQVSGVTYEFVDRPGAETTVGDVYVEGEPLDPTTTYDVTVNSYMAGWTFGQRYGWNMSDLRTVDSDYTLYGTATAEYIDDTSPISPDGEDRIRRVTRTVSGASATEADATTQLSFDVPETVQSVDASTVHIENSSDGVVHASDASVSNGTLTATFERSALDPLAQSSETLQLYAGYTDSALDGDRNSFDSSVLNADVTEAVGTNTSSLARFDTAPQDGRIGMTEVLTAIAAYNADTQVGGEPVTLTDVRAVIAAYNTEAAV
ncbi:5'-nucleotidase C-terminal domain-containing protein [Haloarcula sp. GH36]|uniref:5'-nucleotidase C-terminal domain-containing protein n=1 Tax=Haloarcula montana TaxID=3111776 RepID=UPI002D78FB87|nr:5'-nucleotidase C-terminal domain-containing protein [Haloarcula sp. GH36]